MRLDMSRATPDSNGWGGVLTEEDYVKVSGSMAPRKVRHPAGTRRRRTSR